MLRRNEKYFIESMEESGWSYPEMAEAILTMRNKTKFTSVTKEIEEYLKDENL